MFLYNSINLKEENINNSIDTLLFIIKNLGLLNFEEIENKFPPNLNKDILYELKRSITSLNTNNIESFYSNILTGYGPRKINEINDKFLSMKLKRTKNQDINLLEDLIIEAKLLISRYNQILIEINSTIKRIKDNYKLTDVDKIALIDYWITHYKKEKLGFLINIKEEILSMINELRSYEYDGYGEIVIQKFIDQCQKELIKSKSNNCTDDITYNNIKEKIFKPLKISYREALIILKRRISLVDTSKQLSKNDKLEKIEEFIIDFNEKNGHKIDISTQLLEMKNHLQSLKYGGYGEKAIDKFLNYAQQLIIKEKEKRKTEKEILAKIRIEFKKSITWYNKKLDNLEVKLSKLKDPPLKEELIKNFQKEMEEPTNLKKKISIILQNLENSNYYSQDEIDDFKMKCNEIEKRSIFSINHQSFADEIDELYENLLLSKNKIKEKENLYLTEKIDLYSHELTKLNGIGYGKNAINDFINYCENILKSPNTFEYKKLMIKQKYNILKESHNYNYKIFTIWKNNQIEENEFDKETITNKVNYILTLSPKELQLYLEEDDRNKRKAMERHNNRIIVEFLATIEANKTNNQEILNERLKSLESGFLPYTLEDMERARKEIRQKEYFNDEKLPRDKRLISVVEYINSTLIKQISMIKLSEFKN